MPSIFRWCLLLGMIAAMLASAGSRDSRLLRQELHHGRHRRHHVRPRNASTPLVTVNNPAQVQSATQGLDAPRGSCAMRTGDGSVAAGWPDMEDWVSYDVLWSTSAPGTGCTWAQQDGTWYSTSENSAEENSALSDSIHQVAAAASVDPRFILATALQESSGCVRVMTTYGPPDNPGVMQSYNGTGTCVGRNPCPPEMIRQMIQDGVQGDETYSAAGALNIAIDIHHTYQAQAYYLAARIYNGGNSFVNLAELTDARPYASYIANRLAGFRSAC